jgi:hypothetical protein
VKGLSKLIPTSNSGGRLTMEPKRTTVALIEPAAGNVDADFQKAVLARYANKHGIEIDLMVGERVPHLGAPGLAEHRNLLNDIRSKRVGRLLVVADVRHALPQEFVSECEKAGVRLLFVDVSQEGGLTGV